MNSNLAVYLKYIVKNAIFFFPPTVDNFFPVKTKIDCSNLCKDSEPKPSSALLRDLPLDPPYFSKGVESIPQSSAAA